jgi:hypothetical protein
MQPLIHTNIQALQHSSMAQTHNALHHKHKSGKDMDTTGNPTIAKHTTQF